MSKKEIPSRWIYDYFNQFEIHKHAIKGTVYFGESEFQEIVVAETECFGRCLILDNEFQSAELDEYVYHESLVQPALILHPEPTKVAIIGGGEGAALREVLRHQSVNKAIMVDIDEKVVECSKKYLPSFHDGSYSDERTVLLFEDGRKFLEEGDEKFDVIIMDITCPLEGGPSYKLFTKEFYEVVKKRLTPQGVFAIQASTTSPLALHTYSILNRTLKEVFANVFPYAAHIPFFAMLWGFNLATDNLDPFLLNRDEIDKRIAQRVKGDLRFYDGTTHQSIFNLPKYVRKELSMQTHINFDNSPLMEKFPGRNE